MAVREQDIDSIIKTVLADRAFYKNGGGMTLSGGEPMLQVPFTAGLLARAKQEGIHTAMDTAGNVSFDCFETVLPYTDLFLYDLKCMDNALHKNTTGCPNTLILENFTRLADKGAAVTVRIPVIPGVNNNINNMAATAGFIKQTGYAGVVELLAFHPLGGGKYEQLGLTYEARELVTPSREELERLARPFKDNQWEVSIS
jgi:pyruvate formate lyase activating enzyme